MIGKTPRHRAPDKTRRRVLGGAFLALLGAAAAAPMALATMPGKGSEPTAKGEPADGPLLFDETYKGRRIQGGPAPRGARSRHGHGGPQYRVLVDAKELHVMQNADGTWISVVNHYQTYGNLRDVARAAVDELDGASLVPIA